jgi:Cu+-exporting ATPase
MYVDELTADLKLVRDNRTYYFCATSCMEAFAEPGKELERLRRRLYVAAPLSVVVLMLTYFYQAPYWPYAALVLASVVQFYPGYHFYRGTWDAIKNRVANMDVLIAVGTTVAYLYSAVALLVPGRLPAIYYFDASAMIITLILTGSYLEHLTRERARGALRSLHELLPSTATVVREGKEVEVPVTDVGAEESVVVRPGGRMPADGVVIEGTSSIDESLVTGESMPVEKRKGSSVLAGTMNGEGRLVVRTTNVGENTVLSQIGSLLTEAETSRVPIQQLADRIASVFVPVVLVIAISTGLGWALLGHAPFNTSLLIFVTVAITACPCAFGLATPAAIVMGTGRAAQEGILFKGKDTIEKAASVDTVLTDKTGTLTVGRPVLTDVIPAAGTGVEELLSASASVESGSEHPLARAVVEKARAGKVQFQEAREVVSLPGRGVKGRVGSAEVTVLNGSSVREEGYSLGSVEKAAQKLTLEGKAWSMVVRDGKPMGVLGFFDEPAPGAKEAIAALKADGISVAMVTGDNKAAADRVARELGIGEVYASTNPKGKMEILRKKQAEGKHVAFVGDGINDAPSLVAAEVGVAIGAGTEVAREAGGVVLMRSDFRGVALALRVSRRTIKRVRGNLFWALGYNAVLIPIAAGILIPVFGFGMYDFLPMLGAAAMGLSSTTVLLNSFSLKWTTID